MSVPIPLPGPEALYEVCEATWPPARSFHEGAWTIREGRGGGQRVSSATEQWPTTEADLAAAERAMAGLGQEPIFQIRAGDEHLDEMLAAHGYQIHDPVNLYAIEARKLAVPAPRGVVFPVWPPLALMRELWAAGGIGPGRIAVMERADCPKTAIFARSGQNPGGVAYVGLHDGIAMVHALEVNPGQRRRGVGTTLLQAAARWAVENGSEVLSLVVTQGNHAANPLYASLGMTLLGHYHYRRKPQ